MCSVTASIMTKTGKLNHNASFPSWTTPKRERKDKWNIEERRQNERQMKGKRKEKENPNEKRGGLRKTRKRQTIKST